MYLEIIIQINTLQSGINAMMGKFDESMLQKHCPVGDDSLGKRHLRVPFQLCPESCNRCAYI